MGKLVVAIVTFHRPVELRAYICALATQTRRPDGVLVIDNGGTVDADALMATADSQGWTVDIECLRFENIGFPGAICRAYEIACARGADWLMIGDDDDPPLFDEELELIVGTFSSHPDAVVAAAYGQMWNPVLGRVERTLQSQIQGEGHLDVDIVAGGARPTLNMQHFQATDLPDAALFWGLEDLSMSLKLRARGARVVVPKPLMLRYREAKSRMHDGRIANPRYHSLKRQYYSIRNYVFIMMHEQRSPGLAVLRLLKAFASMPRASRNSGRGMLEVVRVTVLAVAHGLRTRLGRAPEWLC